MRKTPLKRTPFKNKPRKPLKRLALKRVSTRTKTPLKSKIEGNKRKSQSLSKLKKELDRVFSIYIRSTQPKRCYTCGKTEVTLQCGHFVPRQYLATRWSEDNCRSQCVGCNLFGNGQLLDFEENLKKELGEETVENLKKSRHQVLKLDRAWYEERIEYYKQRI